MIAALYDPPRSSLVRPVAAEMVRDARVAGHPVGVLTNDLSAFHSQDWIDRMPILEQADTIVDGSVEGYFKPDPRLYEVMSARLGVPFAAMVFVDDQASNVRGAERLGIPTVLLDPRDPDAAYAEARRLLDL
ncbi:MAG: HAD family hydrolase [Nocardioides sp.]